MSGDQQRSGPGEPVSGEPGTTPPAGRDARTDPAAAAPPGARSFAVGAPLSQLRRPVPQVGDEREQAEAGTASSFYDQVGGHETFVRLVHEFYARVAEDERFRALYPEDDLGPATRRLALFLAQYWGGPRTYEEERGHPRLRMRHVPFAIDADQRDRWLRHMRAAVAELAPPADVAVELERYFVMAAESMRNRPLS